jgi:hypothetical protein
MDWTGLRLEVFKAVKIQVEFFCVVVEYQRFGDPSCLQLCNVGILQRHYTAPLTTDYDLDWIELTYKKFGGKYLRQRR